MEGAAPPPSCPATWTEDGRRRWVKYDGIGPVDETGLPLASRSSVDRPRDWYRSMFQQIHGKLPEPEWDTPCCATVPQRSEPPLDPPALPNGSEWAPWGDAGDTAEPGSIFDYEPGPAPAQRGQPPGAVPTVQPIEVQLQRELEQLSAELDEDIRAMERPQRCPTARSTHSTHSTHRASPTPTAPLSALSPHGLQGRAAVPMEQEGTGGSMEQSSRDPPPPPTLPIAADLGTPAAPTRGAAQMAAARLKFDFRAESPRELSLRRGDVVLLHRAVDANWLRGEHRGRVGIFPRTYVELLPPGRAPRPPCGTPTAAQGRATAAFSFRGELPVELSFRRGEQLSLLRRVDAHWYEGRVVGTERRGIAPRSYLRVHCEPGGGPTAPQPPAPQPPSAGGPIPHSDPTSPQLGSEIRWTPFRALYDYRPQNGDELELREGDRVGVMQCCDDGWFVGVSQRTQKFGTFPGNYVAPL